MHSGSVGSGVARLGDISPIGLPFKAAGGQKWTLGQISGYFLNDLELWVTHLGYFLHVVGDFLSKTAATLSVGADRQNGRRGGMD